MMCTVYNNNVAGCEKWKSCDDPSVDCTDESGDSDDEDFEWICTTYNDYCTDWKSCDDP